MRFPKHKYIRSETLMRNARLIPCQICGIENDTVCGAHSNWGGGKGRSIKADDNLIASLCHTCHMEIDQGKDLSKEARQAIWFKAHRRTVMQLIKFQLWPHNVPIPLTSET